MAATGAALLGYVGLVHWLYPQYFVSVLPKAFSVYGTYSGPMSRGVTIHLVVACVALALATAAGLLLAGRRHPGAWKLVASWCIVGLSFLALFLQQGQGFNYHLLPFSGFAFASLAALGLALCRQKLALRPSSRQAGALFGLVLLGSVTGFGVEPEWTRRDALDDDLTRALRELEPGTSDSRSVDRSAADSRPWSPMPTCAGRVPSARSTSWPRSSPIADEAEATGRPRKAELIAAEADLRRRLLLSLSLPQPEMVYLDVSLRLRWFEQRERPFRLLPYLLEDPAFADAWLAYEAQPELTSIYNIELRPYRLKRIQPRRLRAGPGVVDELQRG